MPKCNGILQYYAITAVLYKLGKIFRYETPFLPFARRIFMKSTKNGVEIEL